MSVMRDDTYVFRYKKDSVSANALHLIPVKAAGLFDAECN